MVYYSTFPPIKEPQTGVIEFILSNPNHAPDNKVLLVDILTGAKITYGQLKDRMLRFAAGLQDQCGFKKGDVLAVVAPNQIDYSIPVFGALAAGGAVTPANPNYNVTELSYQLQETNAKVLIAHEENIDNALASAKNAGIDPSNVFVFGDRSIKGVRPFSTTLLGTRKAQIVKYTPEEAKETVAYLCFSSGTTGRSKGVMTTHANVTANVVQYTSVDNQFIDANVDRMIAVLPFFHIFALTSIIHVALYWGITSYVMPRFDFVRFLETVQNEKITFACLVPPIILLLARHPLVLKYDLSSLRIVICGAAPLSAELGREVKARLPNASIKQGYGLTETSPTATIERTNCTIDGSCGRLVANMMAKIVDEHGQELPPNQAGELWLKGPNIMKGYINNPQATADCIDADGYFHTGDVAVVDDDGNFYIVDRIKELIKYKGFQVPPAELEAILLTCPLVNDAAVIGVYDHQQATELPRACVVLKANIPETEETAQRVMKFVADQVVAYKQLRSVRFFKEIPKSPSGKILRRLLRDTADKEHTHTTTLARL
ncbi:uncharacterized protein BYT42DRAFT_557645 [Radiomyces spectabilis]|uniref:uncharacterized protein n=1 Tax=Radiomyces spectabilis TaxID=64574 RepID=UPI00221F4F46|nr:uncharacterized protein BYT42DRAFT_557645 [Radiomyces spectabilis]KAI8391664.1 hypothetical protein BYT42DRAFT_557645 [Radiomyces spectabilis]